MISKYKILKFGKHIKKLHNDGASKHKIGRDINKFFKEYIKQNSYDIITHPHSVETNISIKTNSFSKSQLRKIKTDIYRKLDRGNRLNFYSYFKKIETTEHLTNKDINENRLLMDSVFSKKYKAKLVVFTWEYINRKNKKKLFNKDDEHRYVNIKNNDVFYTSLCINNRIKNKKQLTELIKFEIAKIQDVYGRGSRNLRLLNISFRLFDYNK